jgi:hypothetical protein
MGKRLVRGFGVSDLWPGACRGEAQESGTSFGILGIESDLEPVFGVLVPEVENAVPPRGRECARLVERYRVDRIHLGFFRIGILPVAFECEILGQV